MKKITLKELTRPVKIKFFGEEFVCKYKVDKSLDKYKNVILFPEKHEKCNEIMRRYKLPE